MVHTRRPQQRWPEGRLAIDPRWIARGLKSFYLLRKDCWAINLVTDKVGGATVGTGLTFPNGWAKTPGSVDNGATLQHGLAVDISLPVTIVAGWVRSSGTVSWSLLDNTTLWTGWYGQDAGTVLATNSNSFDGSIALASQNAAFAHVAANNLRGSGGSGIIVDTTVAAPSSVSPTTVVLGWARRDTGDNAAVATFTHFGAFQGALTDAELQELAAYPMRVFVPQQLDIPMAVAAGGTPTLTDPGWLVSGNQITPRGTYAF